MNECGVMLESKGKESRPGAAEQFARKHLATSRLPALDREVLPDGRATGKCLKKQAIELAEREAVRRKSTDVHEGLLTYPSPCRH